MDNLQKSHSYTSPGFPCYGEEKYTMIRGLKFHYLTWGSPDKPLLVLLHGFLDHSHTFDLLAAELMNDYYLAAWDARGFGRTDWVHPSGYYHFFDYIYDLELFLDHLKAENPVLIGHSMGGMISSLYAGIFPERISRLVNMEGWLVPDAKFEDAPARAKQWIQEVKINKSFKALTDIKEAAFRLQKNDPLMSSDIAFHLAYEGTREENDGLYWRHDPLHRTRSPQQSYLNQVEAFWKKITCPVLLLEGEETHPSLIDFQRRIDSFSQKEYHKIPGAAHNLHLHQPELISNLIREFIK